MSQKITSMQAAKEQLNESIKIFFSEGSDISIHSLTANAHEILRKELKLKSPDAVIILDEIPKRADESVKKKLQTFIVKAKNSFKHANPGQTIKFDPDVNKIWIWDACLMYQKIVGKMTREMFAFCTWLYTNHPEFLNEKYASNFKKIKSHEKLSKKDLWDVAKDYEYPKDLLEA